MKSVTTISRCCCCRQLIPPRIAWCGIQRQLWTRITTAWYPPTSRELADELWADDPNGGPLDAANQITVVIRQMNKKLWRQGIRLRIGTEGRGYRLLEATKNHLETLAHDEKQTRVRRAEKRHAAVLQNEPVS